MAAILDFCVANVIFPNNDPKRVYMPILVLVSLIGQLCPKHVIICPTTRGNEEKEKRGLRKRLKDNLKRMY